MKRTTSPHQIKNVICSWFTFFISVSAVLALGTEVKPKSVVIMFDGMRADAVFNADMPNYRRIMSGQWVTGYHAAWSPNCRTTTGAPADSAPNHVTIATGMEASSHKATGNGKTKNVDYAHCVPWLTRLMQAGKIRSGVYLHSWGEDQFIQMGAGINCIRKKDAENVDELIRMLSGNECPDAAQIYIDLADGKGHQQTKVNGVPGGFYPSSQDYLDALRQCDDWLGKILSAIAGRRSFASEGWMIIVCSDHGGFASYHGARAVSQAKTTPLLLISRSVKSSGRMKDLPRLCDIAPTVLTHHGLDCSSLKLDGCPLSGATRPQEKSGLKDGLIYYLDFDGQSGFNAASEFKVKTIGTPLKKGDGKFGSSVRFTKQTGFLQLENSNQISYANGGDLTFCFWVKSGKAAGNPVIFGNKNWNDGYTPGLAVVRRPSYILNIGSANRNKRLDLNKFVHIDNEWLFFAVTRRKGDIFFIQGFSDGRFYWMTDKCSDLAILSEFPWTIGQDGTGKYKFKLDFDLDDFAFWNRSLSLFELKKIFDAGRKGHPIKEIL